MSNADLRKVAEGRDFCVYTGVGAGSFTATSHAGRISDVRQ